MQTTTSKTPKAAKKQAHRVKAKASEPVVLSDKKLRALLEEGLELGRAFAAKAAPMKVITSDDLKTRMK